jgi:Peptidase family M49
MKIALILLVFSMICVGNAAMGQAGGSLPSQGRLEQMASRFAPTPMRVDISGLSAGDRQALAKLVEAARIFDHVFLQQMWSGNAALYQKLQKDESPLGRARLHYFWINKSPWSEIDAYKAFVPGVPARKPLGGNFYPEDVTKAQLETWFSALPEDEQQKAKGFFSVARWKATEGGKKSDRSLITVPYNEEYKDDLTRAAGLLREAAGLTDNESLKKFLGTRADAFLSNDYYESDMAWMDLDSPLDITIGPYETYNDELFGYKAAFEVYVNLRDEQESAKLSAFTKHLQEIEDNLPIAAQYRNPKIGAAAPMRVVDEIISAGDGAHGIQTAAYNLPNDDRIVQQKGSKRVMIKNVQEAKFHSVLVPIARKTLTRSDAIDVNFESFFTHIVAHELMHGLGPHQIKVGDRETTPREELKELFSAIEEAKADVTGLFALQYMMDHSKEMGLNKVLPSDEAAQRQLYATYLASAFRSMRFGLNDAHGKGMAVQFNYLADKNAFVAHGDGTYAVDMAKVRDAVRDLDHDLLTLEAEGDYSGAKKMLDELGVIRPAVKRVLGKLEGIPTDIEPNFVTADQVSPAANAVPSAPKPVSSKKKRKRHS